MLRDTKTAYQRAYLWSHLIGLLLLSCVAIAQDKVTDLKNDETIQLISTTAWYNPRTQIWHIPIHIWVYEPSDSNMRTALTAKLLDMKYNLKLTEDNEAHYKSKVSWFFGDNERGKQVYIKMLRRTFELNPTKKDGHSYTVLEVPKSFVTQKVFVPYSVALEDGDEREFNGRVSLARVKGISVISDIDDTVKITEVLDQAKMFENTFYKPFEVVAGMPELYQKFARAGMNVHFVSSSPWQLYPELESFLLKNKFPSSALHLKSIRFKDTTIANLFKSGTETKPKQIEAIIQRYPEHRFILIGDSGEEDAQVYNQIIEKYNDQVIAAYIRDLGNERIVAAKEGLSEKLYFIKSPKEIEASLQKMN